VEIFIACFLIFIFSLFQDNDWNAVDYLLTYHGKDVLPHYLAILSNFPETTAPFDYRTLLPEAGCVCFRFFKNVLPAFLL
jgi:hypothetical protein